MKERKKQYLRLGILILIIAAIIFSHPLFSGRFTTAAEKLEVPLSLTLDGIKYSFTEDLTVKEFEENGWKFDERDDQWNYTDLVSKLVQPGEDITIKYINFKPVDGIPTSSNMIYLYIKNTSSKALPYDRCECVGIYTEAYWIRTSINFPQGIIFGDSYGRIEMAYGKGQRVRNNLYSIEIPVARLLYYFDNFGYGAEFIFHKGRLNAIAFKKYEQGEYATLLKDGYILKSNQHILGMWD